MDKNLIMHFNIFLLLLFWQFGHLEDYRGKIKSAEPQLEKQKSGN